MLTDIVQRIYARRSEYEGKTRDLKHFTEVHNVPKQLKQRMQDYFQTVWSINHGIDVSQVSGNGLITLNKSHSLIDLCPLKAKPFNVYFIF